MGLEILDGSSTGLRCFLKRSWVSSFSFFDVVSLYHVNDFFRVAADVMGDRSGFTCREECV